MTVEDLLDWIDRRMLNGTLTAESQLGAREFAFDSGYVVNGKSTVPGEQAEQVLLRIGLIDEDALARAETAQAATNLPLVVLVQEESELDELYVRSVLEQHTTEMLLDTWAWSGGTFTFDPAQEREIAVEFPISVRLRGCIVQGRQRTHRWRQIRAHIPQDDGPLYVVDRLRLASEEDSEEALEQILELTRSIENGWSIWQMIQQWHGWRYRVLDLLALLIERGGVALTPAAEPGAPGAPGARATTNSEPANDAAGLVRAARAQADAGHIAKALDLTHRALRLEPNDLALQKFHGELERSVFAELSRDLLTSFRVPTLLVRKGELETLDLSDTERYLAGRVDGRWDLLSLMRAAPVREVEALITFKRLADRGIISL